jgi:hypothetical protein
VRLAPASAFYSSGLLPTHASARLAAFTASISGLAAAHFTVFDNFFARTVGLSRHDRPPEKLLVNCGSDFYYSAEAFTTDNIQESCPGVEAKTFLKINSG